MKRLFDEPDEHAPIPLAAQQEVDAILTAREEHELREEEREKQPRPPIPRRGSTESEP